MFKCLNFCLDVHLHVMDFVKMALILYKALSQNVCGKKVVPFVLMLKTEKCVTWAKEPNARLWIWSHYITLIIIAICALIFSLYKTLKYKKIYNWIAIFKMYVNAIDIVL